MIALGASLGVPLEHTLSCMQPVEGIHCGQCSKCRERRDAFRDAGIADLTSYATQSGDSIRRAVRRLGDIAKNTKATKNTKNNTLLCFVVFVPS